MTLASLDLASEYRSDSASLANAFFRPCLRRAVKYDRAVGFFASSALAALGDDLGPFLDRGGQMRIIASPRLSEEDAAAMLQGYRERQARLEEAISREIASFSDAPPADRERLELLAWMIAEGRLDVRLALVTTAGSIGMYHEKLGIFEDEAGDAVAFAGSANESYGGMVANFECVDVYCSWLPHDAARVDGKVEAFERLWSGDTRSIEVVGLPEAARRALLEFAPAERPEVRNREPDRPRVPDGAPRRPDWFEPREYQREAVKSWIGQSGRGVLAMATGTGKTLTAMTALTFVADRARAQEQPLLAIVVCPQKHLVTQWANDARAFGCRPLLCFESSDEWLPDALHDRSALRGRRADFALWITTNATFTGEKFQDLIADIGVPLTLIADEMHNLGAERTRQMLPSDAAFRLGLSATPERHHDDTGTAALLDYFGPVAFELPLHEAIERGILTPYLYEPVIVELEEDELEEYIDLSEQISRLMPMAGGAVDFDNLPGGLDALLYKRARLIGGARGKLPALRELLAAAPGRKRALVYCSDSSVNGTDQRQLDAAVEMLGVGLEMRVAQYTHQTSTEDRRGRLQAFDAGDLDALVAIRCLDEGVDVPATERAYILASSTNPRQYVQRRGRVLRRHPGKHRAEIFDFLTLPPEGAIPEELMSFERRLVERELERVLEFARHAENGPTALAELLPVQERYGLLHLY